MLSLVEDWENLPKGASPTGGAWRSAVLRLFRPAVLGARLGGPYNATLLSRGGWRGACVQCKRPRAQRGRSARRSAALARQTGPFLTRLRSAVRKGRGTPWCVDPVSRVCEARRCFGRDPNACVCEMLFRTHLGYSLANSLVLGVLRTCVCEMLFRT